MGLLSMIADKIYGISDKEKELKKTYKTFQNQKNEIETTGATFETKVNQLKKMYLYNYALMMIIAQVKMTDLKYKKWMAEHDLAEPIIPKQPIVAQVYEGLSELSLALPAIWKLGATIKNKFFSKEVETAFADEELEMTNLTPLLDNAAPVLASNTGITQSGDLASQTIIDSTEGLAEGSLESTIAVEGAVETSVIASLSAAAGPAIIVVLAVALLVDTIVSFVEEKKLEDKLEKEIKKLNKALDVVNKYLTKVTNKLNTVEDNILKQERAFLTNMKLLNKIIPANFTYKYETSLENGDKFVTAMGTAANQYGYITQIRQNFNRSVQNQGQKFDWDAFVNYDILPDAPIKLSKREVLQMLNYAVSHSKAMQVAKAKGKPGQSSAGQSMKDLGGKEYPTVEFEIDGKKQTWMAANLDYDAGTGSWYYDNAPANGAKYGRLYNWAAAQGSCPPGWRLPTHQEYENLIAKFGGQQAAFKALKKGGTSGFDAVMGGWATPARRGTGMEFIYLGWAYYWTGTSWPEYDQAWYFAYNIQDSKVEMLHGYDKRQGFSVRYIKKD